MTTFHQLPRELFSHIIKNLDFHDLTEAQKVCRSWYHPAHVALLKNINVTSEQQIERFISSVDQNTSLSYVAAVEKIAIHNDDENGVNYRFDEKNVARLFCRFPNLTQVSLNTFPFCLQEFGNELCKAILKNCPKLNHFIVHLAGENAADTNFFCGTFHKLRFLLTGIDLEGVDIEPEFGDITNYIISFPRLQIIHLRFEDKLGFRDYVFIMEHLPDLIAISVDRNNHEEEDIGETYISRKPKERQEMIIKRFSKVTNLQYAVDHPFCASSIKFIAKYLTGLRVLTVDVSYRVEAWTSAHQQLLLSEVMYLAVNDGRMSIRFLELPIIAECLPIITHKLFSKLPSNNTRVLQLISKTVCSPGDSADLHIQWSAPRTVSIVLINQPSTTDAISTLFENHTNDIDHLEFLFERRSYYKKYVDSQTYLEIFKAIPSLKKATLDIPKSYTTKASNEEPYQHTRMEMLTLQPSANVEIQPMLDTCARIFPNLKYMNLYYYSGIWENSFHSFHIDLTNYSLEQLTLDLTPVKQFMKMLRIEGDFFVVQVESLEKNQRYKLPLDLSSITIANDEDSQSLLKVHISITSLQGLEGCMYLVDGYGEEYLKEGGESANVKFITIF